MFRGLFAFVLLAALSAATMAQTPPQNLLLRNGGVTPALSTDFRKGALPSGIYSYSGFATGTGTCVNASGAMVSATGPCFDYSPTSIGVSLGLRIEEARANILPRSNAFTTTWTAANATAVSGVASPDGTADAWTLTDNATNSFHQIQQLATSVSGTQYSLSLFGKAGTGRYLSLSIFNHSGASGPYAIFDLIGGTVTQSGALAGGGTFSSASISLSAGGFYRITVVGTGTGDAQSYLTVATATSGTHSVDAAGRQVYVGSGSTWFIFGAQLEAGAFPTSYIPTAASPVTRAADALTATGSLATALAAGPWTYKWKAETTGASSCVKGAAGAFAWPVDGWMASLAVYKAATPLARAICK